MRNTAAALSWVAGALRERSIPFEVDGGLAAHAYGATRQIADLDINVPGDRFAEAARAAGAYVTWGPARYQDEHWDCEMLTATYAGQHVDIMSLGGARYFDLETQAWEKYPDDLGTVAEAEILGVRVPVMPESRLLLVKRELGRGVDRRDVREMEAR